MNTNKKSPWYTYLKKYHGSVPFYRQIKIKIMNSLFFYNIDNNQKYFLSIKSS